MLRTSPQLLCWCLGFWLAWLGLPPERPCSRRLSALVLGASLAHLGGAWLNGADPSTRWAGGLEALWPGASVLFVPLGPLLVSRAAPVGWLAATLRALAPGLMVARVGCWIAGCCGGVAALYEVALFGLLLPALRRAPVASAPGLFLVGFGGIRLGLHPVRAEVGASAAPLAIALLYVALGSYWWRAGIRAGSRRRGPRPPVAP